MNKTWQATLQSAKQPRTPPPVLERVQIVVEFLAFLFWLNLLLNFFGLVTPVMTATEAVLNANLALGSFSITPGHVLAFLIAVWASFFVSRFLRFLLEEDVYQHLHLARGVPYAISTMLHYVILLLSFSSPWARHSRPVETQLLAFIKI